MFKNAIAYSVVPGFRINPELLERRPARECAALEAATDGFVAPCQHSTANLVHHVAGYSLICWQTEDKILPGSVVEEAVDEKVAEIELTQGRRVGRKERKELKELKEKAIDELLPRAFVQKRRTFGLHDRVRGLFVIDTSSPPRAEKMLEAMRKALDVTPMSELQTEASPSAMMAAWISCGEAPYGMTIDDECLLEGASDAKEQVRYARTSAQAEDVRQRVAHGFLPRQLGMTWGEKVSFVLSSELHLRRLSFVDIVKLAADPFEDEAARFDAEVTIAAGETTALIERMVEHFGGLKKLEVSAVDLLTEAAHA